MVLISREISSPSLLEKLHKQIAKLCLGFPESKEQVTEKSIEYSVEAQIFAVLDKNKKKPRLRILAAPYSSPSQDSPGRSTRRTETAEWTEISLQNKMNWDEIQELLMMGYCQVAPIPMLQKLGKDLSVS